MNYSPLILIVDDEVAILQMLKESLQDEGFRAETINDGNKALNLIGELVPDLVLLDIFMPNCNGLELLGKIKKEYPGQKIIIISGFGNVSLAVDAIKNGAIDFIEKPFNFDDILSKLTFLKNDQKNAQASDVNHASNFDLKSFGIIGESFLFLELMTQIKNVAHLKFPLLIYGEHGTGKTLISKFIHQTSARKEGVLSVFDCNSIDSLDSKIFDFSGTIVLKNIDGLSLESQQKLLQLMDGPICKKMIDSGQIKIIATSSKHLFKLMRAETFNSTLFYKLNITPIEVPSINKRRYDIPLLINYFLNQFNKKYQKNIILDTQAVRLLRNHYWVGNIAQIEAMLEKVVSLASVGDAKITAKDLQAIIDEREIEFIEEQSFLSFKSFDEAAQTFEKKYLLYVLRKNNFDLQQASEKLGLSVSTLGDKISALKISFKSLGLD